MAQDVATFDVEVEPHTDGSEHHLICEGPSPLTSVEAGWPPVVHVDEDVVQDDLSSLLKAVADTPTPSDTAPGTPWFAWAMLFASLVAVSSAAVVFASIPDVPTFTLAAWRLQLTTLLLTPAAIYQYRQLTAGIFPAW